MKLRGDKAMTSGHERVLTDHYREFKKLGLNQEKDESVDKLEKYLLEIPQIVFFKMSENLSEGKEKTYHKAYDALEKLCVDIINIFDSWLVDDDQYQAWKKYEGSAISKLIDNPAYKDFYPNVCMVLSDWVDEILNNIEEQEEWEEGEEE